MYLVFIFLFIPPIFANCSCYVQPTFNITNKVGFSRHLTNPISSPNCSAPVYCNWNISRALDYDVSIEIKLTTKLHTGGSNWSSEFIGVTKCGAIMHGVLIYNDYPFNTVITDEMDLCVFFNSVSSSLATTYWNIEFNVIDRPEKVEYDISNYTSVYTTSIQEFVTYNSRITDINFPMEVIVLSFNYNESFPGNGTIFGYESDDLTNLMVFDYYDAAQPYPQVILWTPFTSPPPNSMTLLTSKDFPTELRQMFVYRNSYFSTNCNDGDPTISIDPLVGFVNQINHTIRTKNNLLTSTYSLCNYDVLIPYDLNQKNMTLLYYFVIDELRFTSAQDLPIMVYTREMGQVNSSYLLFGVEREDVKAWKNFPIFGGMITFNIPIFSNLTIMGRIEQEPKFEILLEENGPNKGILMSPYFPDYSLYQSVNYTLSSPNALYFQLLFVYLDSTNTDWNLYISTSGNAQPYHFNSSSFKNETLSFHATSIFLQYHSPSNSTGMTLKYSAGPIIKKKPPLWIIGLVLGIAAFICLMTGVSYFSLRRWRQRKRKIKELSKMSRNVTILHHYEILAKDPWMIDDKRLQTNFENPIGTGYSSTVYRAQLSGPSPLSTILNRNYQFGDCKVAIKIATCKGRNEELLLRKEIEVMKEVGYFEHVIAMLGWYYHDGRPALVFELAEKDLLSHVQGLKEEGQSLPIGTSLAILWQVSKGMEHISSLGLIHRDLAARNILLTSDFIAKISDFGLCCKVDENNFYQAGVHKQLPMKWLSIEALASQLFSEKSDIWAFGVMMYEVFSRGQTPYASMDIYSMKAFLLEGKRLECPEDASEEVYGIMTDCWKKEMEKRPSFEELTKVLYQLLEAQGSDGYLSPMGQDLDYAEEVFV